MIRYSLLDEPLLSVADAAGRRTDRLTLPSLYAALVRDEVGDFPAVRPHQRHVWHAFLVQVAALALHRDGRSDLPDEAEEWRRVLLKLTPDDSDSAAWALVTPHDRPALLQPPVPGESVAEFKKVIETPDALDMLVTANNHDAKRTAMVCAQPEHWVYALVSLQTQEGYLGSGNYGISRMNSGYGSRSGLGVVAPGGPGARVQRDVMQLLELRSKFLEDNASLRYPSTGGHGLLWLIPWDGRSSLPTKSLDLYYVEVCRRVRMAIGGRRQLLALKAGSKTSRIDATALKEQKGRTGDPWTPLLVKGTQRTALTLTRDGFSYRRLVPLLFSRSSDSNAPLRAPLQQVSNTDALEGLAIVARGVARGEGGTSGYHERYVPVSRVMRSFMKTRGTDDAAKLANERVEDAGTLARRVLFPAVLAVFTAAPSPGERKRDDDTAKMRAKRSLRAFDREVDGTFFDDLDREIAHLDDPEALKAVRAEWLEQLRERAHSVLKRTLDAAPTAAMRSYRTRVRATRMLERTFHNYFGHRIARTEPQDRVDTRAGSSHRSGEVHGR